jgi:hypothetical protein
VVPGPLLDIEVIAVKSKYPVRTISSKPTERRGLDHFSIVLNFAARRAVMNRRDFFQLASGSVALVAFQNNAIQKAQAASQSVAGRKPEDVARDEDYWG